MYEYESPEACQQAMQIIQSIMSEIRGLDVVIEQPTSSVIPADQIATVLPK